MACPPPLDGTSGFDPLLRQDDFRRLTPAAQRRLLTEKAHLVSAVVSLGLDELLGLCAVVVHGPTGTEVSELPVANGILAHEALLWEPAPPLSI